MRQLKILLVLLISVILSACTRPNNSFVVNQTITSFALDGLRIGMMPDQVRDVLGVPVEEKTGFWRYDARTVIFSPHGDLARFHGTVLVFKGSRFETGAPLKSLCVELGTPTPNTTGKEIHVTEFILQGGTLSVYGCDGRIQAFVLSSEEPESAGAPFAQRALASAAGRE